MQTVRASLAAAPGDDHDLRAVQESELADAEAGAEAPAVVSRREAGRRGAFNTLPTLSSQLRVSEVGDLPSRVTPADL
jgi:hypothetical protein